MVKLGAYAIAVRGRFVHSSHFALKVVVGKEPLPQDNGHYVKSGLP